MTAREKTLELIRQAGAKGIHSAELIEKSGAHGNLNKFLADGLAAGAIRRNREGRGYRYFPGGSNGNGSAPPQPEPTSEPAPVRTMPAERPRTNQRASGEVAVDLTAPCAYLVDRLVATGLFGRSRADVVEQLVSEGIRALIIDGTLIESMDALRARGEAVS